MFEDDEMYLTVPVDDPIVTFTLCLENPPKGFEEKVFAEIVKSDEWDVCDVKNKFSAQYYGTTLKQEHIYELLGYAEEAVDDSIKKMLGEDEWVEGEAFIEIEEIGKYRYSFFLPGDGENIIENLEAWHSFMNTDSDEKDSSEPYLKIVK
ncbi:hypothetical protein [uncultured Pseudodesulfovibrio sp.]|uniref:hypothetical protein n=1 Tax=uncultured Pseudodesulfovibrio sp. TaxID=2035858 RepID=UPI0029C6517C|nr:hypothetical protein [uncultured Pseudodesulfovibrio sp.]